MNYINDKIFPNSEILNSSRLQYFAKKSILRSETTSLKQTTKSSIIDINAAVSYNDIVMENIKDKLTSEISANLSNNQSELKRLLHNRENIPIEIIDKVEERQEEENNNNINNKISNISIKIKNVNNNDNNMKKKVLFGDYDDTTTVDKIQSLLVQQKTISREAMETEQKTQLELSEELLEMTTILKKSTVRMNQSVKQQNVQLDSIQVHAADNIESLEEQRKMMSETSKVMKKSIWSTFGSIFWIIGMFIFTYLIMRILPKPK